MNVDEFLGRPVSLDFFYFSTAVVADELARAGFAGVEVIERAPFQDVKFPSQRIRRNLLGFHLSR